MYNVLMQRHRNCIEVKIFQLYAWIDIFNEILHKIYGLIFEGLAPGWLRICFNCQLQCLSQDLETGCLKLAVVKFWGVQIFKEDHNIIICDR